MSTQVTAMQHCEGFAEYLVDGYRAACLNCAEQEAKRRLKNESQRAQVKFELVMLEGIRNSDISCVPYQRVGMQCGSRIPERHRHTVEKA